LLVEGVHRFHQPGINASLNRHFSSASRAAISSTAAGGLRGALG